MTLKDIHRSITEAQVKRAIVDRLQLAKNQGQLTYFRMNAGGTVVNEEDHRYFYQGCPKGTAAYLVLKKGRTIFLELKRPGGKQTKAQKEFEAMVKEHDAEYYLVDSVDKLEEVLDGNCD